MIWTTSSSGDLLMLLATLLKWFGFAAWTAGWYWVGYRRGIMHLPRDLGRP